MFRRVSNVVFEEKENEEQVEENYDESVDSSNRKRIGSFYNFGYKLQ